MYAPRINGFIYRPILYLFCPLFIGCATTHKNLTNEWQKTRYVLKNAPVIGKLPTQQDVKLGGFSGLAYTGLNEKTKEHTFITITDRGPNADFIKKRERKDVRRPFVAPTFNPQLIFLETNSSDHTLNIIRQLLLTGPNGKALSGLPPPNKDANGHYEEPATVTGEQLRPDLLGLDTEAVALDELGNYWVGEEYRPAILCFSSNGHLVRMYVPENYYSEKDLGKIKSAFGSSAFIRQILPKDYRSRRVNRGFEGITVKGNTVIAALQSALDKKGEDENFARWLTLDMKTDTLKEFFYPLSNGKENRIGDITIAPNGNVYVIEQNAATGPQSLHNIYEVPFSNLNPETTSLTKTLAFDMVAHGVDEFEKVEGLAIIPYNQFTVINDNDFGLTSDGDIGVDENRQSTLTIFTSPSESAQPASDEIE
jgi:hypothetical protein